MGKKTKEKKAEKQLIYDLFDNPMVRAAMASMTPEQINHYKMIGESMYKDIDFEKSKVLTNTPPFLVESLAYINESIKSGLHISELTKDERNVMIECYGEDWYTRYGYIKEDLDDIVTFTPVA